MKLRDSRGIRLALVFVTLTATVVLMAHTTRGQGPRMSLPSDWSHRHVVFSAPSNIWQSWQLQKEPRYWQQLVRRNADARRNAAGLRGAP